jgi:hypothetical protein
MHYQQIEQYLKLNDWKKVDNTNDYICKTDINFRFTHHQTKKIDVNSLPESILSFAQKLSTEVRVESVNSFNVEFKYNNNIVQYVVVFQINCLYSRLSEVITSVYFTKPLGLNEKDDIGDQFYIALIEFFNDENGLKMVQKHYGELV